MKTDISSIIEIYKNSTEIEQIIFVDLLSDLIKCLFVTKKAKKTSQSIYIKEMAENLVEDFKSYGITDYKKFSKQVHNFIYKGTDLRGRNHGIINIEKPRALVSKKIKQFYVTVGEEELESIHYHRDLFFKNLIHYGILEIFVSKNEEYNSLLEKALDDISEKDDKNKRILLSVDRIKDKRARNAILRMQYDCKAEKVKKLLDYICNDLELINYLCYKKDLETLYQKITGKEFEKKKVEYTSNPPSIEFEGQRKTLKKGFMPERILTAFFGANNKGILLFGDLFTLLFKEEYSYSKHTDERKKITQGIDAINRTFRNISDGNNLFQFNNNIITKLI